MMTARLRNWSVVIPPCLNPFMSPEQHQPSISGKVYGHDNLQDGEQVLTTGVVAVEGRKVKTLTNNLYELEGDPSPRYLEYLEQNGHSYDPENPLRPAPRMA